MGLLDLFNGGGVETSAPPPDPYSQFDSLFDQASKETGIPVAILKAQTMQESSFDPNIVSRTGGVGLMQIQPSTAQQPGYGIDPLDPSKLTDPAENIRFGARYLAGRAREAGVQNWNDPQQAAKGLTAYNGGGDPNYAQNVFRYLRQPAMGAEAPATGPVDMYGNPLRPRGPAAQAAPQEPAASPQPSSQPQQQAPSGSFVNYANQGATRNKPLQPELVSAMSFLPQLGVTMRVNSGGQDGIGEGSRRTGSTRHDHGGAGDVQFMRDGKALSWENPQDVPVLQQIVRQARQNGVTGIGAGPGYMNPTTTHIGFGKTAIWGAQGGSPYQALAEAVGGVPAGAAAARPAGQRNPQIANAAERGRGSLADTFTRGGTPAEGPRSMPTMMAPDLSNANDAGVRDFILREAGMAPDQTGGAGFTVPQGATQTMGGLGGLGGISVPAASSSAGPRPVAAAANSGGGFDIGDVLQAFGMSLMSSGRRNPLENFPKLFTALQAASQGRSKTAQEQAALATALVGSGMTPQQAQLYAVNPAAAQIALKQVTEARGMQEEAKFNARLNGGQPSAGAPAGMPASTPSQGIPSQGPAPIGIPQAQAPQTVAGQGQSGLPQSGQPSPSQSVQPVPRGQPSQQPGGVIDTGNKTVDSLFGRRAAKVQEYSEMARNLGAAPTDRAKAGVEGRLKALEKDIGQLDKQIETYSPTGPMKEYTYAMGQRQLRGEPIVPFERWSPEDERKQAVTARGALPDEVTGLRKEVQGLPSYKNISQAAPIYKSMMDAVGRDTRASDVNMIYGLAKIMDPTSVVRESEMTVAQAIATLPQQIQQNIKSQLGTSGRLSADVREGIMQEAYSRMNSYNQLFSQDTEQYRGIAQRRKMDLADVIPTFGEFKPYEPAEAKPKAGASGTTGAAPALRETPSQYVRPDGSSPPMPSAAPPPKAFTKSDWDKLSPGELYIDAKGDTRRKGGN